MSKESFSFKEFVINQDKTAMKVGTDAVLLGAWCSIKYKVDNILDIGSGTGIISLMLAQRSDAFTIDAVELDTNAYEQSVGNFENSDWADRLFCYHVSFLEFADEIAQEQETYDLIVSNPPFYRDSFETEDESRNKARFTTSLSFDHLIDGVSQILSEEGIFAVIIPFKEEANIVKKAVAKGLCLVRCCHVKGTPTSVIKRSLLEFSFKKDNLQQEELIIETARHQYTEEYIHLTKDFYLKM